MGIGVDTPASPMKMGTLGVPMKIGAFGAPMIIGAFGGPKMIGAFGGSKMIGAFGAPMIIGAPMMIDVNYNSAMRMDETACGSHGKRNKEEYRLWNLAVV